MRTENDDFGFAVRERYGAMANFGSDSHQALRAVFEREFPHLVKLDFENLVDMARKSGSGGRIFTLIEDWGRQYAQDEWKYLTGSPYGDGIMFFRSMRDATIFRRRFGGDQGTTYPPEFPKSRWVAGAGQYAVPIGWFHLDGDRRHGEASKIAFRKITEWCSGNVSQGLWSIGVKGPPLRGGYEIVGDFVEHAVQFTHEAEAERFRRHLEDVPLGIEALSDETVVEVGYVTWPGPRSQERDVASMFPEDRKWCSENGVGFTWQVLTTSQFKQAGTGLRSYRTMFRFRDRRTVEAYSRWRQPSEDADNLFVLI